MYIVSTYICVMGDTVLNSNLLWAGPVNETYFDVARLIWNFNSYRLTVQFTKLALIFFTSKYSRVSKQTLGLQGGEQIAIIRASGSITRIHSSLSVPSSGIVAEQLIEKIRTVRGKFFIVESFHIPHTFCYLY
jgi:hypothetical protein